MKKALFRAFFILHKCVRINIRGKIPFAPDIYK
jgi:hypothetical protein